MNKENSDNYLAGNVAYWEKGYNAPMVDHHMFRFYGRILKPYFNLPALGSTTSLLDFGCGQGAAVNYFTSLKFDAYGCDISTHDIGVAKTRFSNIANAFSLCDPDPKKVELYGPLPKYDIITGFQSLYYFSKPDFQALMGKLYDQLKPGGVFFATMMSVKSSEFYDNSAPTADEWLRAVNFSNSRVKCKDYYIFFVESEEDLKSRFSMFKPLHIGYYCAKLTSDEGDGFHYTFCGVKE